MISSFVDCCKDFLSSRRPSLPQQFCTTWLRLLLLLEFELNVPSYLPSSYIGRSLKCNQYFISLRASVSIFCFSSDCFNRILQGARKWRILIKFHINLFIIAHPANLNLGPDEDSEIQQLENRRGGQPVQMEYKFMRQNIIDASETFCGLKNYNWVFVSRTGFTIGHVFGVTCALIPGR